MLQALIYKILKSIEHSMQTKSVADHLLYAALKTPYPKQRAILMPGAHDLAKCKRMSYDATALEAVDLSRKDVISTHDILSHFKICKLPFDNVWLEGPHPAAPVMRQAGGRAGFILKNQPDEGFSIDIYTTMPGADKFEAHLKSRGIARTSMNINGAYISHNPSCGITVNSQRIDLDDASLSTFISERKEFLSSTKMNEDMRKAGFELEDMIDINFNTADFIARLIVMMNSKPLGIEGAEAKDSDEIRNDRQIQSSFMLKVPREVDVRPIKIDLARFTKARLQTLRSDEPRDNQGITSVCGHMCYPKKREPYWMPPCDRAKLLPGDNRDAERQLRSTQEKLSLAIQGGAPARIVQRAEASLKKFSI